MNEQPAPDLADFRVELESPGEGIRRVHEVRATSAEQAAARAREADLWPRSGPGSDPARFRVVEVTEQNGETEARAQRNARRRYLNTVVEAGLAALGENAPVRSDAEHSAVLRDFFTRAVVHPGGDLESGRLLDTDDAATVMARLLESHLTRHGLRLTRASGD